MQLLNVFSLLSLPSYIPSGSSVLKIHIKINSLQKYANNIVLHAFTALLMLLRNVTFAVNFWLLFFLSIVGIVPVGTFLEEVAIQGSAYLKEYLRVNPRIAE